MTKKKLDSTALNLIFQEARTLSKFLTKEIPDDLLKQAYDLSKMGPTSFNCCPMRITFVKSPQQKEKLKAFLDKGNVEKTMKAPVTAIICYDLAFYKHLPRLFSQANAKAFFEGNEKLIQETAQRNGSLQGAYFIIALRALSLDCGPMSGFDNRKLDDAFFANTSIRSNFLINIGHGDYTSLPPRNPRLSFEEVCKVV